MYSETRVMLKLARRARGHFVTLIEIRVHLIRVKPGHISPLHNIPRSLLGEGWYFRLRIRVSAYPLNNIPRSLLGEEWYFPLRIRESTSQHTISLLGEGWYFRLPIRVSSLFRGAASKWQGILQLLRNMLSISGA